MNDAQTISKREHKLLISLALAVFVFSYAGYISYTVEADRKQADFYRQQEENRARGLPTFSGPYCYPDRHPLRLLIIVGLTLFTFVAVCVAKTYVFSFLLTIFALSRFVFWFTDTRRDIAYSNSDFFTGVDRFFYKAGIFDLLTLSLILALAFWQISIHLRILRKRVREKEMLP